MTATPSMNIPEGGNDFVKQMVDVGMVLAKCYSIVDLGTQNVTYEGKTTKQRKFQITFETQQMGTFKDKVTGQEIQSPLVIGKKYTLSLGDKSNLRRDLKTWLGKEPDQPFDIFAMVGKTALIQVMPGESKEGKEFRNISAIMPPMPKNFDFELINPETLFSLEKDFFSAETFETLPEFLKKQIIVSDEYIAMEEATDGPF